MNVGISDDSMSHTAENNRPSKHTVSLTVEQGSESSGNTEFYEDPMEQSRVLGCAAASSSQPVLPERAQPVTAPVMSAMPEETGHGPITQAVLQVAAAPSRVATPILPFTGSNPVKRSGSNDIESERPA